MKTRNKKTLPPFRFPKAATMAFLWVSLACVLSAGVFAQSRGGTSPGGTLHTIRTPHYQVFSEISPSHALETGAYLEQLYQLYNSYFHFVGAEPAVPWTVKVFRAKESFDEYLSSLIPEKREDFVYLHHPDPTRRELLLYQMEPEQFYPSLHHQAFLQFLRNHIQHPPLWMREGFAVFFEKAAYDPASKKVGFKENLEWLDALKAMVPSTSPTPEKTLIPLERFLFLDPEEAKQALPVYYPQAWGFVTFLLQAENRAYQRFLWTTLALLKPDDPLQATYETIRKRILPFYDLVTMERDFHAYIERRPSFTSLMKQGIAAYEKEAYKEAEEAFLGAAELQQDNPLPHYYLGLVAYAGKNYQKADERYKKALSLGGQKALIQYALGVNAFAWNRPADARTYLNAAVEADPSLKEKADPILKRLQR